MTVSRLFAGNASYLLSASRGIRGAVCLLCAFVVFAPASACSEDIADWENISSGTAYMSRPANIEYQVGYSSIGYDHFRSEIMVNWHDGEKQSQTIYDGIYDRPPAKVWGVRDHLCVSMQACTRYEDSCTTHIIAYSYDMDAKLFSELPAGSNLCIQKKK